MITEKPIHAGAFELTGISGASLACGADVLGIRLVYVESSLGVFDGKDLALSVSAPPVMAPDLSYVRYEWRVPVSAAGIKRYIGKPRRTIYAPHVIDYEAGEAATVTLEWQFDGKTLRGQYTSDCSARFALIVNGCFRPGCVLAATPTECLLEQDASRLRVRMCGEVEEPVLFDNILQVQQAWVGVATPPGTQAAAYPVTLAPGQPLLFSMALGDCDLPETQVPSSLAQAAQVYEATRMRSTGDFEGAAQAVASLSAYSQAYDPKRQAIQTTVNRTWGGVNRPGLIFGWDNFFTSYLAAWENPQLAAASLEHIVGVYGENGIAKGPVQRNLIIPVVYCRTIHALGDFDLARRTWASMMAFMRFWFPHRDGNGDGLIESGSSADATKTDPGRLIHQAMDETGYDEISIYSAGFTDGRRAMLAPGVRFDWPSRCLTVTLVCQNALYITACRAMSAMARRLGQESDAIWLDGEGARVTQRMREQLFSATDGIFRDRYWEGGFSPVKAMTVFFPLLAGIADDKTQAKLFEMLTDPHQFWGDNLTPTISRDDPTYCDGLDRKGNYWRGNCWPPTTYMVYLAAKEAGWDSTVAEYGRRTWAQFMEYWEAHVHAYENYPPEGKVDHEFPYVDGWGGREVRYVWAGMMLFCGLEEIFGLEVDGSLRFGNPYLSKQSAWSGFLYQGQRTQSEAGPEQVKVAIEGGWEFLARPGIAVRNCVVEAGRFLFRAIAPADTRIEIHLGSLTSDAIVQVDGCPVPAEVGQGCVAFTLPVGISMVKIG